LTKLHAKDIQKLALYGGRAAADTTVFTDIIIGKDTGRATYIYLASIAGSAKNIDQARILMELGSRAGRMAPGSSRQEGFYSNRIAISPKKNDYNEYKTRIGDVVQSLYVSKLIEPKIQERREWEAANPNKPLPNDLTELVIAWDGDVNAAIYKTLQERYTTPILDVWKDDLANMLIEENFYEDLTVFTFGEENPIKAGLLKLKEADLENIVSEGVKSFDLEFALMDDDTQVDLLSGSNSLDEYLLNFAEDLTHCLQDNITTRFDPSVNEHHKAFRDVNLTANKNGLTGLFRPQADAVMGVAETLKRDKYSFVIGEMG